MKKYLLAVYKIFLLPHLLLYSRSANKNAIDQDLRRWAIAKKITLSNRGLLLHFLANSPDFRTLFYFRTRGLLSHILNLYCRKQANFTIDITTKLAGGVLTGHPYCTILNADSIGENFYVNHLVTVGEVNGKRPTIGANVSIYTGAIVIGDITIGDNSSIGAGAVVVKNVPENCIVVGNPARIISQNGQRTNTLKG